MTDPAEVDAVLYEAMGDLEAEAGQGRVGSREGVRAVELPEFLDAPEPEFDWAIPGLLERMDRLILTGGEGHGKSTLLRQLGVQASCGIHPFGGSDYEPLRVLMVDAENTARQVRRAFRPLRLAAGGDRYKGLLYVEVRPAGLDLAGDRNDAEWLLALTADARPDLLIIGPLYKLHSGDPTEEGPAKVVATLLDKIRVAHGCAVILEAHSPHATGRGTRRPERPYGASLWLRWPEFGIHLSAEGDLRHWRGARDVRDWPAKLQRGGAWPWTPVTRERDVLWARIKALCVEAGDQLSYRDLASTTSSSLGSITRAIDEHRAEWDALTDGGPE